MQQPATIQYVLNSNIDRDRWDACMDLSVNRLIYGYSWYLDNMAKNWDALILNDYEAVMPLTWNKKWGFRYLYQPPLTAQCGIFSPLAITPAITEAFINNLKKHFRFAEICFNYGNYYPGMKICANFILPLNRPYQEIRSGYKGSLIKNLNRSARLALNYTKDFDLKTALDLYRQTYASRTPHVKPGDWNRIERLSFFARQRDHVITRAVYDEHDILLAVAMLFRKKDRMYLLESTTLPAGRTLEANHFLLDHLIQEFAGSDVILDFEGSDIPGIAYYYQTFGSIDQPYYFLRYNHLPWWIRWLKRA